VIFPLVLAVAQVQQELTAVQVITVFQELKRLHLLRAIMAVQVAAV
jgi:hypothetical protein